jgi:hypothetical protein
MYRACASIRSWRQVVLRSVHPCISSMTEGEVFTDIELTEGPKVLMLKASFHAYCADLQLTKYGVGFFLGASLKEGNIIEMRRRHRCFNI